VSRIKPNQGLKQSAKITADFEKGLDQRQNKSTGVFYISSYFQRSSNTIFVFFYFVQDLKNTGNSNT